MQIVVSNISKKEEIDFKQRVLETMKKQIRKKLNHESKFSSNSISQTDQAMGGGESNSFFHLAADSESNSTLRTFSSDK